MYIRLFLNNNEDSYKIQNGFDAEFVRFGRCIVIQNLKKQDKRTRIINAAIEIFADKGYHLGNMNDIATKANVAVGSIYRYFTNKEDLLIAIFEEKMGELIQRD